MLANADIIIAIQPAMYVWMQSWEPNVLSGLSRTRVLWLLSRAWMIRHLPVSISLQFPTLIRQIVGGLISKPTGGKDAKAPALKAVARAGAKVVVQWSGIVRAHFGPAMTVRTLPFTRSPVQYYLLLTDAAALI